MMPPAPSRWNQLTDQKLAELLRLIAHPTRLVILRAVADGERCVAQLNELVPVSQPNLSQHLRVLRDSELIQCRRDGRRRCYSLTSCSSVRTVLENLVSAVKQDRPAPSGPCGSTARDLGGCCE